MIRLISFTDFIIRFRSFRTERQINSVHLKIEMINQAAKDQSFVSGSWIDRLLQDEPLDHLDRETVVEMLSMIHVYENHSIRIAYNFSDELEALLDNRRPW